MKKVISLILLLSVILVTGCKNNSLESVKENPHEFTIVGDLPDIGEFSGNKSAGRFYDEITYEFIPSDDYDLLVPYSDGLKDFDVLTRSSYGFCTPDGKIVMDASYDNTYVMYRETDDGFGYYDVSINNEESGGYDDMFSGTNMLVSADGKFCIKAEKYGYFQYVGNGIIVLSANDYESNRSEYRIYDYKGNHLISFDEYDHVGDYSNGLFCAANWDGDLVTYYYIDINGDKILGPFNYAGNFNKNGIAAVKYDEDGGYCLIDTNGNRLTEEAYYSSMVQETDNGEKEYFVMRHIRNRSLYHIYDSNGKFLTEANIPVNASFRFPDNGDIYYYYYTEYPNMVWKKLSDNSDFVSNEVGYPPNSNFGGDSFYVYTDSENSKGYFFDCNGDTITVVDDFYGESADSSETGRYITYITGSYDIQYVEEFDETVINDTRGFNLFDVEKNRLIYTNNSYGYASYIGEDERYALIRFYKDMDVFSSRESSLLFDLKEERVIFDECKKIEHFYIKGEDYFIVYTENSCILYDSQFKSIKKTYYE